MPTPSAKRPQNIHHITTNRALVFVAVKIWVPIWSRLRVMSIYEYLERRYHPGVRTFGAVMFIIGMTFWLGTALVAAAMGFESVTGFDGRLCLVVMAVIGTAYTVFGGMRAMIWTDVAQFIVFMIGYAVIFVVLMNVFDWDAVEIYRLASVTSDPSSTVARRFRS